MSLSSIYGPGYAGYMQGVDSVRQKDQQNLQTATGLMSLLQRQKALEQEAQMQPLRMQEIQARLSEIQRRGDGIKALEATISALPPDQQALARANPQAWAASQMARNTPKVLPSGAALVRPDGTQIFTNPKVEPKSPLEKEMDLAGITDPAQRAAYARQAVGKRTTHAPAPSNTMVFRQETEEAKAVGKALGTQFNDIQKAGFDASSKINRYSRLAQLLDGVDTGKLTPLGTEIAAFAQSLGFKIDPNLDNKQAANALANEIALTLRNPSGGAGMPGALSDKDREFLVAMVPGLARTPGGNKLLIETAMKLARRDQDVARLAREYRQKNGSFNEGFYEELQRYADANPLFPSSGTSPQANAVPSGIDPKLWNVMTPQEKALWQK